MTDKTEAERVRGLARLLHNPSGLSQFDEQAIVAALRAHADNLDRAAHEPEAVRSEKPLTQAEVADLMRPGIEALPLTSEWQEIVVTVKRNEDKSLALHSIVLQPAFEQPAPPPADALDMYGQFQDYVVANMPPGTVISNPEWWAGRLWRAMLRTVPTKGGGL